MKRFFLLTLVIVCISLGMQAQKTYALLVGISNYGSEQINNLNFPVKDVKRLKKVLDAQGFRTTAVTGRYATPDNIRSKVAAICRLATSGDHILFFFSGHGDSGVMCCYQGTPLYYSDLAASFAASPTDKVFCFIDACHSGTALQGSQQGTVGGSAKPTWITACRPDEYSIDMPVINQGLFTKSLLKGLRGMADANADRRITLQELYNYIYRDIVGKTRNFPNPMHPQLIGSRRHQSAVITKW